jgi:hypothetical protein
MSWLPCITVLPSASQRQHLAAGNLLEEFLEGFLTGMREQAVAYLEIMPEAVDALVAR